MDMRIIKIIVKRYPMKLAMYSGMLLYYPMILGLKNLSDIAFNNVVKLKDRQARNVIGGSGDKR